MRRTRQIRFRAAYTSLTSRKHRSTFTSFLTPSKLKLKQPLPSPRLSHPLMTMTKIISRMWILTMKLNLSQQQTFRRNTKGRKSATSSRSNGTCQRTSPNTRSLPMPSSKSSSMPKSSKPWSLRRTSRPRERRGRSRIKPRGRPTTAGSLRGSAEWQIPL